MSLFNDNGNYTVERIEDGTIWEGEMKHSEWEAKYRPIKNHISKYDDTMFETYGAEVEYVNSVDPKLVWTWIDGDMSSLLVAGKAFVNRLGYYVCEVPWETGDEQVLLSVEVECECYDEERFDYGGDPDCDICEGNGLRTEYLD